MTKECIANSFKELQLRICAKLEVLDGVAFFNSDEWDRAEGGGGLTNTMSKGAVIEKGGVAFSEVFGPVSDEMKNQLGLDGQNFFASGVSIVLHPNSPHIPIIHMNIRYFELDGGATYWFGGGIDLTPHYIVDYQAFIFHQSLKSVCDQFDKSAYDRYKKWADSYFFIPHRDEARGIGGIFFDHQTEKNTTLSKSQLLDFCLLLGDSFTDIYSDQVALGRNISVEKEHLDWRNYRRGRYVEFNLVHDRGTKFGLFSGGRTESILMSLPPIANWEYNYKAAPNSMEEFTLNRLKKPVDWLN